MKAEVRVAKTGSAPLVQVAVDAKATPEQIGKMVQAVYSNPSVYRAGGIRECLTCKSGIQLAVVEDYAESVTVESK
jgi:deoxyribose-phosphate aldolase